MRLKEHSCFDALCIFTKKSVLSHSRSARMLHKNNSWKCSGMKIRVLLQKWKFIPSYFHSFWPSGHYQSDIMNAPLIHSMPIVTAYSFNILLDFLRRNISLEIGIVILVEILIYFMTSDLYFKVCSFISYFIIYYTAQCT